MPKTITLIRGIPGETHASFHDRILALANRFLTEENPVRLSLTITVAPPPLIHIIPFQRSLIAAISVYRAEEGGQEQNPDKGSSGSSREGDHLVSLLAQAHGFSGTFSADEALPVAYRQTWPDGEMTPGICLLTLFHRKQSIDQTAFLDRWHNSHTPLSLKIHPLWHYSRNVVGPVGQWESGPVGERVDETSTARPPVRPSACPPVSAGQWDGIVEEHVRERRDLLNPFRFFGPPHVIIPRMIEVYRDTASFLDYNTIETYLTREYVLRSTNRI